MQRRKRIAGIRMTTAGSKRNKQFTFNPGIAFKHNTRVIKTVNSKVNIEPELHNFMAPGENFLTRFAEYEEIYTAKVSQKPQKNAIPLREMIVITDTHTTLEDLKTLTFEIQKLTNWRGLHIAHHKDEGHYKTENGKIVEPREFITNYHAHLVFECYNKDTGKSIRLTKKQMSTLQDLAAKILRMPRGEINTGRVHLEPEQYRQVQIDKDNEVAEQFDKNMHYFKEVNRQKTKNLAATTIKNEFLEANYLELTKQLQKQAILATSKDKDIETMAKEIEVLKTAKNTLKFENTILNDENDYLQNLLTILGLDKLKIKELKTKIKDDYTNAREVLKQSGLATQQNYQDLKIEYDKLNAMIKKMVQLNKQDLDINVKR